MLVIQQPSKALMSTPKKIIREIAKENLFIRGNDAAHIVFHIMCKFLLLLTNYPELSKTSVLLSSLNKPYVLLQLSTFRRKALRQTKKGQQLSTIVLFSVLLLIIHTLEQQIKQSPSQNCFFLRFWALNREAVNKR